MKTLAVAKAFARTDDWVCQAIHESGIDVPADFSDMFAARVDPSRCKRVNLTNAKDVAQHMERLEKARHWFLTHVDVSALRSPHTYTKY
jgi:hypothetical protein